MTTPSPAADPVVDIAPIIEHQKVSRFWIGLFVLSWAITFLDGFDFQVIGFAGSFIKKAYQLSNTQLGTLGSVGLVGLLVGGLTLGYLGDRIGRRRSIILAVAGFGVFVLLFPLSQNFGELLVLRLLSGVFLGGVLPLIWALCTEYAPSRMRSTSVVIIMIGYSLGTALGGPLSNLLIPPFGWQSVFVTGGIVSLVVLVPVVLFLPESVKFLAEKDLKRDLVVRTLRRAQPDLTFPEGARFVVGTTAAQRRSFRLGDLFRGRLAAITPTLWVAYICSSAVIYFLAFWQPILNQSLGFTVSAAANIAAGAAVAGAVGQLIIGRFIDIRGTMSITVMPVVGLAGLLLLGLVPLGPAAYIPVILLAQLAITGGHGGMHSISGIFYRPAIRANGAAWATSIAKVGAIIGPWLAGVLMDGGMGARSTFFVVALFPLIMAMVLFVLGRLQRGLPAGTDGALSAAPDPAPATEATA
jgi:AAHS family 4-hydroxybenzoate transporter-like MFS transporter